ncbi:hypothetical protein NYZ75_19300, partial [Acinetobacter baumannii]|nr:hypothetical protein [Acinetobacter baumannii]
MSKYNNLGRALVGISDLRGVAWLIRRSKISPVEVASAMLLAFMNTPLPWLEWTGLHASPWKLIGLTGALMFGGRWLVQFVA